MYTLVCMQTHTHVHAHMYTHRHTHMYAHMHTQSHEREGMKKEKLFLVKLVFQPVLMLMHEVVRSPCRTVKRSHSTRPTVRIWGGMG